MKNEFMESDPAALVKQAECEQITLWSETKKTEFVDTFDKRVRVARYLLEATAYRIMSVAMRRKFVGRRHVVKVLPDAAQNIEWHPDDFYPTNSHLFDANSTGGCYRSDFLVGGRTQKDLCEIAFKRAEEVLGALPPIQKAVAVIDPETAKMMDKIEALKKQGQTLTEQAEEASEPILMAELDQKMTIGAFREMVKQRDKKRRALLQKISELGKEGSQLEEIVAKRLFKGIPGLADAVVDVAQQHIDRSKALDAMGRRVAEQVKFGDSDAALELLRTFEKDEAEISVSVKKSFDAALAQLKIAVKKGKVTKKSLGAAP